MFNNNYSNFVPAGSSEPSKYVAKNKRFLSGDEARKIYLEEIKDSRISTTPVVNVSCSSAKRKKIVENEEDLAVTNKDLFLCVEKDNVNILKNVLNKHPEKIHIVDDFGWSLLMIACQANSVETTIELLKRGVDISIRDKAGNSAHSLVIKNKNYLLADILLKYNKHTETQPKTIELKQQFIEVYACDICNKTFPNRQEHLSSTIHNINASKGKKIPAHYVIPASNKGYQLMLKGGWDRDSGLGRDGHGKKYPIKTIPKNDRKGLGHNVTKPHKNIILEDNVKHINRRQNAVNLKKNRIFEIKFRREFY